MLELKNLNVKVGNKELLKDVNLKIKQDETHLLFGPNGSGKSSLVHTLLGLPRYKITSGKIIFNSKDITNMKINERVKLGLGIQYQNPPVIRGVKLKDIMDICHKGNNIDEDINKLKMQDFLERDINLGFSGGEIKRSEILQMVCQKPLLTIFDEPDSGVDIENIELLGKEIQKLLENKSGLVITHSGHILRYIKADFAHVIINGKITCTGDAKEIFDKIQKCGFAGCARCEI